LNYSAVKTSATPNKLFIAIGLLIFIMGLAAIHFFVEYEKNRDLITWQNKLSFSTQVEKKTIDSFLQKKIAGLHKIANNSTLKLYLSNLVTPIETSEKPQINSSRSYKRYLRELIIIKSSELGFSTSMNKELNINQNIKLKNGLMIVDNNGQAIVSGLSGFAVPKNIKTGIQEGAFTNSHQIIELISADNAQLHIAFVLPIFPPQVNADTYGAKAISYLIAIKDIAPTIKQLLYNYVATEQFEDISLIRKNGQQLLYLLSISNALADTKRQFNIDTPELAAVAALQHPNQFLQKIDHLGRNVLLVSSRLNDLPWGIMHTIEAKYALSESNTHALFLYISFCSLFIIITLFIIIVLRRNTNEYYQQELNSLQLTNQTLTQEVDMFQMISDNSSDYAMLLDQDQNIVFGNKSLSTMFGLSNSSLIGQNLPELLERSSAKHLKHILSTNSKQNQLVAIGDDNSEILHTRYKEITDSEDNYSMLIATDISSTMEEEKYKETTMQQVVVMLTKMLEQHDSYSAEHSSRVKTVAVLLGHSFSYSVNQIFNITLAASLINIGKFYIPSEILLKQEKLTEEEQKLVQGHILHTIRMLEDITLDKEITQAITQSHERLDGSGFPHHLQAEQISPFARILGVANSFVAMTRPRPWRQGMEQAEALDILMKSPGYDKKIIMALYSIIETNVDIKL